MPKMGNHRRPRTSPLARRIVAVCTGGAALTIPLVAATSANAAPAPAHAHAATQQATSPYTVVAGDSLFKIAKAHSVSGGWKQLYKENRQAVGDNPALIKVGLQLKLDGSGSAPQTSAKSAPQTSAKSASRSGSVTQAVSKTYSNNLDGWIKESLAVMAQHNIPGSYDGIYRNVMRESSGNPQAINNTDSNAAAGTPSKGLLQVIDPTFQTYHVAGTSMDSYDPVANITAACNYAAQTYGSIDNVNGPY